MNSAQFEEWLRGWLKRHPLKDPPKGDEASYIAHVMAQIRSQKAPIFVLRWPAVVPRLSFALGTVLASLLLVTFLVSRAPDGEVRQIEEEWELLLQVSEESQAAVALANGEDPEAWLSELLAFDEEELSAS